MKIIAVFGNRWKYGCEVGHEHHRAVQIVRVPGVVLLGVQNVTEEIKFIIARDVAAKEKEKVNFSAAYANRLAPVYFVRNEVGHPAKHSNNTR